MWNLYNIVQSVDIMALHELFAHRIPFLSTVFLDITRLGGTLAVFCIGGTIALILVLNHRVAETLALSFVLGGTAAVSTLMKILIARPRPELFYQLYPEHGFSFPSQHTALSTALFLYLIHLAYRLTPSRSWRLVTVVIGTVVPVAVGMSRLYLGVHYLSDVIGGLLLGALFALSGTMIEHALEHLNFRHTITD